MEKPDSPGRCRFVELHVRGFVCLGWREIQKQWQNVRESYRSPTGTRHSVIVFLTLSNLKVQATKVEANQCLS